MKIILTGAEQKQFEGAYTQTIKRRLSEMIDIAELIKKVIVDKKDPKKVRNEVSEFRKEYQEIKYCFQTSNQAYEYFKLY